MSIYFDFITINELTGDIYNRQPKEFTLEELSQYNGSNGSPAYVAIEGIVYDISHSETRGKGTYSGTIAGQDLSNQCSSCNGIMDILTNAPIVGTLSDEENMNDMDLGYKMSMKRQVSQDKSKFTPDDWIRYITPLVIYALREPNQGMNIQSLYQKVILMGVLVGLGKTPQEAINQVRDWQNTGTSQILKGGLSTGGGPGTTGGIGTGGSQGTGFGTEIGGSPATGMGTTGGVGTGGSGTGTSGGLGAGGIGMNGFGTGGTSASGVIGTNFGGNTELGGNINKNSRLDLE